jgi:hypothetical protein
MPMTGKTMPATQWTIIIRLSNEGSGMQDRDIHDFLRAHADPSGGPANLPVMGTTRALRERMTADDIEQLRVGPAEADDRWPVYLHRRRIGTMCKDGFMRFEPESN